MKFISYLSRLLWVLLFVALLAFALRNTEPVALRVYFDRDWRAPLVLVLFAFFLAGVVFGLLAGLSRVLRQRREIIALKRELRERAAAGRGPASGS